MLDDEPTHNARKLRQTAGIAVAHGLPFDAALAGLTANPADIFGLDPAKVDREARRRAKTINFGLIYGMSAFGLAARLGIPPGEARAIIDAYFARYPGVRDSMERLKEDARTRG